MSDSTDTPPRLDLQRLAEAVAELVNDDLDDLYGQRMLSPPVQSDGPERDAVVAASNIAYLTSRLLPQILRYQSSVIRLREEEARKAMNNLQDYLDNDIPF